MRRVGVPAGFDDVGEADEVAFDVGVGVFEGVANAGLGGEVDDAVEAVVCKALFHGGPVGEVGADAVVGAAGLIGSALQLLQARFFEGGVVVVVDHVEADHGIATPQQLLCGVEADEASVAGDEDFHLGVSCVVGLRRLWGLMEPCAAGMARPTAGGH